MAKTYYIRNFDENDLMEVMDIALECFSERYAPELFLDIHRAWPEGFLVAVMSKPVGFLAAAKYSKEARILMLGVRKNQRKMGIGSALMRRFIAVCRAQGLYSIRLEVRTTNISAIEFYKKFGFNIISFIPGYYSNGDNAYVMWRVL